ncbi:class I SAM-dependent methyltransferase [Waterburya agarophytonicola K14]|uniref:Class I SAM-dependent methyltransferase n=1 Tax=Waterburya agarophytonicola KI4 TaxID=2874699 RepID=A0A964FH59_9CYAN|nr:class I SAM-dependent methyltransferase [Waterburya agarophytonicola]MCC0178826.1 class I SAM-dependent methyltransferase [Waterburya agarophytonicola KI4]
MNYDLNVDNLKGVSETLLTTLYLRSLETKRKDGIIRDYKSVDIVKRIDYDFSECASQFSQAIIAIRTEIIDELVKKFISQYPDATIINLGTGLCTRYFRVDNSSIDWFCIDLPVVKPIWDKLIGESERLHYLSYSALDFSWIKKVKETASGKILFIAEGLLMFFSEIEVKQLFSTIKSNFSQSEIIFDSLGVFLAQNSRLNSGKLKINASYKWGIKNLKEIQVWESGIRLTGQWHYLDRHKNRLGLMGWLSYIPAIRRQVKIGHLQFV